MATKFVGILPLTRFFNFDRREGMYTTLLMSTGLTFGTISALFGLTNHIIDQQQYTILVTAVIGSAVVPTLIAQRWFQPSREPAAAGQEVCLCSRRFCWPMTGPRAPSRRSTAIGLAKHYGAELHMIWSRNCRCCPRSIDEVVEEREEANQRYRGDRAGASARYMQGVTLDTDVVYGHPVPTIIDFIERAWHRSAGDRLHGPFGAYVVVDIIDDERNP